MAASTIRRHSLLAGIAALALTSACVQEQDYLIVERAVWFGDRDECTLDENGESPLSMTADVMFESRIAMGFVVTNDQSPNEMSNSGIDDSKVEIESVQVNLSYSGGAIEGGSFEMTVQNTTIAGGDSDVFLVQLPTTVTDSLRASLTPGQFETLDMEVVFVGRRTGQSYGKRLGEVKTRAYTYPFDICMGCLSNCFYCEGGMCPTSTEWVGTCGFAQGLTVYHPACDLDTPPDGDTGP